MPKGEAPNRSIWPLFLLFGTGAIFCLYLFSHSTSGTDNSLCELFASDCQWVTQSEYGSWFSFPVASLALAYFTVQLGWLVGGLPSGKTTTAFPWCLPLLLNLGACLASIYFIHIMQAILKETCVVCYLVHLINFLSLLCIGSCFFSTQEPTRRYLSRLKADFRTINRLLPAILVGLIAFLTVNLYGAMTELAAEKRKLGENLQYFQYLHRKAPFHVFTGQPEDEIIGDREKAIHEIVLVYKEGCPYCQRAKDKLSGAVREHKESVFLVLKNYKDFSKNRLKELAITRAPAVFIDGRRAEGWDIPGFLNEFTEVCGC